MLHVACLVCFIEALDLGIRALLLMRPLFYSSLSDIQVWGSGVGD